MNELERLEKLEQSLQDISKEILTLKKEISAKEKVPEPVPQKPAVRNTEKQPTIMKEEKPLSLEERKPSSDEERTLSSDEERTLSSGDEKRPSAFEEKFGGKVMGILAACLILIGLVMFGTMLYQKFSDTARVVALYVISFLILASGLQLYRRFQSWFTLSLIGCGFSAVYISLFLSKTVFNLMTEEVLYGLILVWLFGIGLFVFKSRSTTVAMLGEVGIFFSVIAGALRFEDETKFLFLCLFFFLVSILYLWVVLFRFLPETGKRRMHYFYFVAVLLNEILLMVLSLAYEDLWRGNNYSGYSVLIGILSVLYMGISVTELLFFQRRKAGLRILQLKRPKNKWVSEQEAYIYQNVWVVYIYFSILQVMNAYLMGRFLLGVTNGNHEVTSVLTVVLLSLLWMVVEWFGATGREGKGISAVTFISILVILPSMTDFAKCTFLMISSLILLVSYFWREYTVTKEKNEKDTSLCYLIHEKNGRTLPRFISITLMFPMLYSLYELAEGSILGFVFFSIVAIISFITQCILLHFGMGEGLGLLSKQRYPDFFLCYLYFAMFLYSYRIPWGFYSRILEMTDFSVKVICFIFPLLLNAYILYSGYHVKLKRKSEMRSVDVMARILNLLMLLVGMVFLHARDAKLHPFAFGVLIALTAYLCGSGMYSLVKRKKDQILVGLYLGFKVTVYVIVVLTAFRDVPAFVMSGALFLIAIAAVLTGFSCKLVSLRLYGLFLSMLAVLKLLVLDIQHENTMQTVGCFLAAGTICFCISLIYSKVKQAAEKKLSANGENT